MNHIVVGGGGFIGSSIVSRLMETTNDNVIVYDNFSSGKISFLEKYLKNSRMKIVIGDAKNLNDLTYNMKDMDKCWLFCSNPDIAAAVENPLIDFYEGTLITQNVVEAMRVNNVKNIVYASGSGVYGDKGLYPVHELLPTVPVSPYGASKLGSEAILSAYSYMYKIKVRVFRFANVIGKNQTHGVGKVFLEQLLSHPTYLDILGNGKQTKSYIHIDDILNAVFKEYDTSSLFDVFNVATTDYLTVDQIANIVCSVMKLENVEYRYSSKEARGWVGDIGVVVFNTDKIRARGWDNRYSSQVAMKKSIEEMMENYGKIN